MTTAAVSSTGERNSEALLENRSLRDRYADKVEALKRVGTLTMLPDDLHVTVEMVARFFKVEKINITQTILRHKDELIQDGIKLLTNTQIKETLGTRLHDVSKLKKAPKAYFIPRRAVLRIGMLLRNSEVAVALRSYLLNVEEIARKEAPHVVTGAVEKLYELFPNLPRNFSESLRQLADSYEENETLKVEIKAVKKEIKTLAPKAEKFDEFQNSDGYYYIGDLAKVLNPKGMGRNLLFAFLRDLRVLVKDFDNRSIPTQRYMKSGYFKVVFREYSFYTKYGTRETRKNATTYVTPKGMDFIRDLLIQHGYLTAKKEVC